jgi:transcriptional regulator with XRE-family HTH domain
MTLGERIHKARIEAKLSKSALARAVGVSHTAVARWESDETKSLQADNLFKIANATGADPHWLQGGQDPQRPGPTPTISEPNGTYNKRVPIDSPTLLRLI